MRRILALTIGLVFVGHARASAVILDFEDVRQDNATVNLVGPVYSRDGFTLTALVDDPNSTPNFFSAGTLSTSFAGSTALYHHISGDEVVLTRTDGVPFNLHSVDLAELPGFDESGQLILAPFSVTFRGTRSDSSMVLSTVTHSDAFAFETFPFDGFTNLTRVNWFQGTGNPGDFAHQFDNLNVSPVPEPSSLLLLGCGLAGLLLCHRPRQYAL